MLDHKCNNAAVNQRFSAEQSRFAGARIVRRPPYEIKSACDATRAACGSEISNISTDIEAKSIIMKRACRASVSGNQTSRGKGERHEPFCVIALKMQRRSPDCALVPQ